MKILVVAAHPDDEALGCGGTIARHASEGDVVEVAFLADGVASRPSAARTEFEAALAEREAAAVKAAKLLGAQPPRFLKFPDNACDSVPLLEIAQKLEKILDEVKPKVIYTHHVNDLNVDHRIAHQAVLTACRPVPGVSVRSVHAFETASSTEWEPAGLVRSFQPTRFVDISLFRDAKRAALSAYATEMRPFPHPRSMEAIEAQWTMRGAQSGLEAAEAFVVIRETV